jgi:iron complex outermembrane receptor protein
LLGFRINFMTVTAVRGAVLATAAIASLSIAAPSSAQGIGQQQELIIVTAARAGSPTAPSLREAREALERIPGAIGFVDDSTFADDFTQSIGDALALTPGVFADISAQRESRISVRGSGLNSGFERRGLTVLRDGVPISRASGSTEFQEVDPLTIRYLEVFKGANGLRFGASSLGGAVNVVSPTGRTARAPFSARIEGGSFETLRGNISVSGAGDRIDYFAGLTGLSSAGYREHSNVRSVYGHGNIGIRLSDTVETRFYFTALSDNFELAGSLRLADALANPRAAGRPVTIGPFFPGGPVTVLDPGPVADDWDRNLDVYRVSNLTAIALGDTRLELGAWYARRNLDHAITRFAGIIVQGEDELGASLKLSGTFAVAGRDARWTVGGWHASASNDARTFANVSGARGALRTRSDQDSATTTAYAELDLPLSGNVNAIASGQYARAVRDVVGQLATVSGRGAYDQFNPRIGLIARVAEKAQLFANVSRSFEPPSLADLTAGGAAPFAPLRPQQATTYELGTRGQAGALAWDIAVYRADIENEFIDTAINNGANSVTVNAGRTLHQGIEAGLDLFLAREALKANGQQLRLSLAYTLNDFRFRADPVFGGNRLAGVPRHVLMAEARFDQTDSFYVSANLRWIPQGPWADYANTERPPGYEWVGLTAGVYVAPKVKLFASVENLFDVVHISNVATVANQSRERAAIYTPGQGRAVYGGLSFGF